MPGDPTRKYQYRYSRDDAQQKTDFSWYGEHPPRPILMADDRADDGYAKQDHQGEMDKRRYQAVGEGVVSRSSVAGRNFTAKTPRAQRKVEKAWRSLRLCGKKAAEIAQQHLTGRLPEKATIGLWSTGCYVHYQKALLSYGIVTD